MPTGRWTSTLDREFAAGARLLLVLCNPHNPIGKAFDRAELEAICEVVERHGGLVFSDEIHAPLSYPGVQHVPYASINDTAAAHTVTAMSASKSFNLAGLKCAQLILTIPSISASTQPRATGYVRVDADGHDREHHGVPRGRPWLAEVLDYLDGNRRLLTEMLADLLPAVGYIEPEASFLAWLDCRELGLDDPRKHFLKAGWRSPTAPNAAMPDEGTSASPPRYRVRSCSPRSRRARRAAQTGRMVEIAADVDQRVVAAEASSHARRGRLAAHRVGLAGRRTVHQIGAGPEGHPDVVHDTGERAAGHLVDRGRLVAQ